MIDFPCPECGANVSLPGVTPGATVNCAACGASVTAPEGSVHDPRKEKSSPFFTGVGIVIPLGIVGIGVLLAFTLPTSESDWFGARFLARIALGCLLASIFAVVCSVAAILRNERGALLSLITGLPALLFLLWVLATALGL